MRPLGDRLLQMCDAALTAASNGIVVVSGAGDHGIVYCNAGFERMTGYRSDDVLGRNPRFLQGPDTDRAAVAELDAAVRAGQSAKVELLNYRQDGTPFWNELVLQPVSGESGTVEHWIGVQTDVTDRVLAEADVRRAAARDPLTGLLGRVELQERLRAILDLATRSGAHTALLAVDVDGFRGVNDRYGQDAGDELLRRIAARLGGLVRPGDVLARSGGDEFLVVLTGLDGSDSPAVAADVGRRMLAALRAPFSVEGRLLEIHGSIGAAVSEGGAGTVGDLLGRADQARRRTKASGGDAVLVNGHCTGAPSLPARRALAA